MRFSIIIPAYNAEQYLSETLETVAAQSFLDYELLLIDDGSTDGTREIVDDYASQHRNVTVLGGPNKGPLLARRRGLSHCRGEYVVFVDADDCLRRDALEVISAAIDTYHPDIVSYGYTRMPDFAASRVGVAYYPAGFYDGENVDRVRALTCLGNYNNLWNKVVRRTCYDLDADYMPYAGLMHGEDLLQLLPVLDAADSVVALDDVLYYYRPSEGSSTSRFRKSQARDITIVCSRLNEYAAKWGGACVSNALVGEAAQYIGLLQLATQGNRKWGDVVRNLETVRETMKSSLALSRSRLATLRLDQRLMLYLLKSKHYGMLTHIARVLQTVKKVASKQ